MSQYEAYLAEPEASGTAGYWEWDVKGPKGVDLGARYLSEAEADIIAFALNAIADGFKLLAYKSNGEYGGGEGLTIHRPFDRYAGPTEGVAP